MEELPDLVAGRSERSAASPLGMYYRECVDFALWRVNQQMGSTSAPFKFLNGTFRPDGQSLGSALTWKAGWDAKGWPTGSTPRVGAVVWYAPGAGGADPTSATSPWSRKSRTTAPTSKRATTATRPRMDHSYYTRTVATLSPQPSCTCPLKRRRSEKAPDPDRGGAALRRPAHRQRTPRRHRRHQPRQPTPSAPVSLSANSGPQAPGGTVPATIGITWDQASKDNAVEVAEKAMADFARPGVEEKQWANDLARWLTPQATADYSAVDPANIPATRVTGPATLTRR